ncbi:MAG: SCO family protein [Pyrinomonadaceae bacterium]
MFSACQKPERSVSPENSKRYRLHGKVISVNKAEKTAAIAHDDIKGYMPAMTMDFPVKNDDVLNTLSKDAEVDADLVVDNANGKFWLENFSVIAAPDPNNPAPAANENVVQTGKEVPDFKLTNQDGKSVSFKDFKGKALAITFIYTRCPLPDYCIKMSKNFSDLANQLAVQPETKDKIRLLSISFDPTNDTPDTLKKYGLGYLGKDSKAADFSIWQLATAPVKEIKQMADFFGLQYQTDENNKTSINHSLRTVVIAPDGTVQKVFTGSDWTNEELLSELQKTLN